MISAPSSRFESASQKWKKGTINLFCPGMESSTYLLIANGTINLLIILMGLISIYIFNDPNGKVFVQQRQFNSERQKRNYLRINERKRLHTCFKAIAPVWNPIFKTSTWNECVFGWMSHPTYVISLSPQTKWYMLIWFKYWIPLTCLKWRYRHW